MRSTRHRNHGDPHYSWHEATTLDCDKSHSHPLAADGYKGIGRKFHTPGGPHIEPEDWPYVSTILFFCHFDNPERERARGKRTHSLVSRTGHPVGCRVERKIEEIADQPDDIKHAQHPQRGHELICRRPPGDSADQPATIGAFNGTSPGLRMNMIRIMTIILLELLVVLLRAGEGICGGFVESR